MNIKQLQAKVKAAQKANAAKVVAAALKASLEATLTLESSKVLFDSKVKLAVSSNYTNKLQKLVDECAAIVDSVPVINTKTKAQRVWAEGRRFTFGTPINLMYQIANGINYSCAEHRPLLLNHTGLSMELIEQFLSALGKTAYYSRNFNTIVEAKAYDVEAALATVAVMQSELGVVVDTSLLTEAVFKDEFEKAEINAKLNKLTADEAIAEADLAL